VIHVVRKSRGACVVAEVLGGHRPAIWVSDLYSAQQGHAAEWQVCLAHQLRDCQFAIEAGDAVFAPRMKALLLRAVVIARRRGDLAESTRREYRRRLDGALDAVMALAPANRHGQRLRRRYGKVRDHLFTFLDHPEVAADNNRSERELRPTATYRKVTGGFRSDWGADLFAAVWLCQRILAHFADEFWPTPRPRGSRDEGRGPDHADGVPTSPFFPLVWRPSAGPLFDGADKIPSRFR
jgi:transposase